MPLGIIPAWALGWSWTGASRSALSSSSW